MSATFQCGDQAALIGYLYDDCDPTEAAAIAGHLAICATCAQEVRALEHTRQGLQAWTPPDVALGFQVVPSTSTAQVLRPARWWARPLPAWAQVAAAVVLFSTGVVLGSFRGGAPAPEAAAVATASTPVAAPAAATVSTDDLAALEQRLRAEFSQARSATPGPVPASTVAPNQGALMQQVRTLIEESERRQQRELTLRTAEVVRDVDAQRRGDLARIERTFGQMEGNTGVQVEQQRQLLNYLMRVSQRQPQ